MGHEWLSCTWLMRSELLTCEAFVGRAMNLRDDLRSGEIATTGVV